MQVGGPVYTVPVTITGVQQVGTVTLTLTYNPAVLRASRRDVPQPTQSQRLSM